MKWGTHLQLGRRCFAQEAHKNLHDASINKVLDGWVLLCAEAQMASAVAVGVASLPQRGCHKPMERSFLDSETADRRSSML